MSDTILCPTCKAEIEVTEVLSTQIREQLRREYQAEQRKKEEDFALREAAIANEQDAVEAARVGLEKDVQTRLAAEREKLTEDSLAKAKEEVSLEMQDMQVQLQETKGKLQDAQKNELELRKQRRELEEQKETLNLEVERTLDEERGKIRETARKEVEQERQLKDADKDKLISDLRTQIEELSRKSEQGSQQSQGEVLEIALEDFLRREFPYDTITPVPKGIHGGDALQTVRDVTGAECGSILWESKRTKAWNDGWLPKLRDDQRAAKAQAAVLVSIELPKGIATFSNIDGVWVTSWPCCLGVAAALRVGLVEVAHARQAHDGKQGKMEVLYNYLSGQEFRHRVEGIVEAFVTLRDELESEKRSMNRVWAKREKQLERALVSTAGLYGDLSGIIGARLPAIAQLELAALPGDSQQDNDEPEPEADDTTGAP